MKIAVFSSPKYEKDYLIAANNYRHDLKLLDVQLALNTVHLAIGCEAICIFVNDDASAPVIDELNKQGVKFIALRCSGFNQVNLEKTKELKIKIANVPAYSPNAVAEHAIAMMLALNRKLITAHKRMMEQNYSLDGLVGFNMNDRIVGIIGTGKIGAVVAKILHGFGCKLIAFDHVENESLKK